MEININLTEEQNLINHINKINEHPLKITDIVFGLPNALVKLPNTVNETNYTHKQFTLKNTAIKVTATEKSRWSGEAFIKRYRRIHLGVQWLKFNPNENTVDDKFVIPTDSWKHSTPTAKEVFDVISKWANFRRESLLINVIEYTNNGRFYDTGKIRVYPKDNSLLYIGYFDLDVVFHPITFMPEALPGFISAYYDGPLPQINNNVPLTIGDFNL